MEFTLTIIVPSVILAVAVVFDLLYKKFPNYLFLIFALVALATKGVFVGFSSFWVLLIIPLGLTFFYFKVLGAGDIKLLFVLSILIGETVFEVLLISVIWGGIFGLTSALFHGKIKDLILNMKGMIFYRIKPYKLNFIPYTVCLSFAWLTHLFLKQRGVLSW